MTTEDRLTVSYDDGRIVSLPLKWYPRLRRATPAQRRNWELIGRGYMRLGAGLGSTFPLFWETGMGGAEINVDLETGEITLEKYVTVVDVGKAINPLQAEGQDEGAAIQGLGHTLFESLVYENGQPLNAGLIDYRVPRFTDLPEQFDSILIENEDGPGPYGAKGMGESGIVSVAPAVGNALLAAALQEARERGAVQMVVVCGHRDDPKRGMLAESGFSLASEWYVQEIV